MSLTSRIQQMQQGDEAAKREVFEQSYPELRSIARHLMRGERSSHTLGATGLLHEAFLGPLQKFRTEVQDRSHFYALAAMSMRRMLMDHGRRRRALKRLRQDTPHLTTVPAPEPRVLDLMRAIEALKRHDPRAALVVEMKHVLGLTLEEIAAETGQPYRQVRADWDFARGWLATRLAR
jgi:RNA polymerase sigma factor (TIGR02999 family)